MFIEFTKGEQHQFIIGKANWTFAYLNKAHTSALNSEGHFVLILDTLIHFDKIH